MKKLSSMHMLGLVLDITSKLGSGIYIHNVFQFYTTFERLYYTFKKFILPSMLVLEGSLVMR